jgi:RNA polymerase sigma-70 factor (ECF subfamily)
MPAKVLPLRRLEGTLDELSDEALLAAAALGERGALGRLFDRHYDGVRGFLCHLGGWRDSDLDDLVQTTFEKVQRSAHKFKGRSQVRTWILGIARNVARRQFRTRSRRARLELALTYEPREARVTPIDEELIRRERLNRLRVATLQLSPKLREVFALVYIEGVPGAEAAVALGIREGTLWKRLHDARSKLERMLEEES